MSAIPGDLVLLAAVARMYGFEDSAQDLYLLAQLATHARIPMRAGDMNAGLSLLGLLAAHTVAARDEVPHLISTALEDGHVVLAEYRPRLKRGTTRWTALCQADGFEWRGLAVDGDFTAHSVGSDLAGMLTGHYLIITRQLPEWPEPSRLRLPLLN